MEKVITQNKIIKFEKCFIKGNVNECWVWNRAVYKGGYGAYSYENKACKAHRFSYMCYIGSIPTGMMVCHTCDNPCCVNPYHLFLGTAKDNMQDKMNKGRYNNGLLGKKMSNATKNKISKGNTGKKHSDEVKAKTSKRFKKLWEDPEYRKKVIKSKTRTEKVKKDPKEVSEIRKIAAKKLWQDPEYRIKMSNIFNNRWKDPDRIKKQSEIAKKRWKDPYYKEKMCLMSKKTWEDKDRIKKHSDMQKKLWENPEYKEKMSINRAKVSWTQERRDNLSERNKKRWQDPEYRIKMSKNLKKNKGSL